MTNNDKPVDATQSGPSGDMAAFSANERACYLYPGVDQAAERAAFCEGAAYTSTTPTAPGEVVKALEDIDASAPAKEPRDGPTVGFQPSHDPEQDDGNDIVEEAFREGVARGLWEAAKVARATLTKSNGDPA